MEDVILDLNSSDLLETMKSLNICDNPLDRIDWSEPGLLISLVILGIINVLVLLGNCLVVLAVFLDSRLRTVTNLFIVSLAMADLSVGVAVLPFSASLEVLDLWIFGEIWCSVWLAVDVWMCTASILNLCAISLDRYLAVTRPVSYPSLMSPTRAKILLAIVWSLSFVICFPPLVGWNDRKANQTRIIDDCNWTCELTNDAGYVVYSALGSFFIPMLVMLFFYWRIYRAAVKTIKAINQGFRTTKEGSGRQCMENKERLTLRIHRGRSQRPLTSVLLAKHGPPGLGPALAGLGSREIARLTMPHEVTYDPCLATTEKTSNTETHQAERNGLKSESNGGQSHLNHSHSNEQQSSSWYDSSSQRQCHLCQNPMESSTTCRHLRPVKSKKRSRSRSKPSESSCLRENVSNASKAYKVLYMETPLCGCSQHLIAKNKCPSSKNRASMEIFKGRHKKKNSSEKERLQVGHGSHESDHGSGSVRLENSGPSSATETENLAESGQIPTKPVHKLNRRNIKAQVKRFKMETKAAKTLGIIVGGFIFCWLPFFTMYVIRAFCPQCIPHLLFSILFWLGYCNSAINPCIYALFSKDFRFAFQKILCKCLCTKKSHGHLGTNQALPHTICFSEDSDFANEHSESN